MKTTIVIFGLTGDLGRRKLLPALRHVLATGDFDDVKIIGISRHKVDTAEFLDQVFTGTKRSHADRASFAKLAERVSFRAMDLANDEDYLKLIKSLKIDTENQVLFYLAVPPAAATQIVDHLGKATQKAEGLGRAKLNTPNVKILFEKPFGVDLASAKDMVKRTGRYFDGEGQIYRIDHFLAKEMAQNIVAFRGGNALFANLWNRDFIESIDIIATENLDIQGRGVFYEQTGALRDVLQGHLMQLLALTLMNIPAKFDWNELPKLRLKALAKIQPADPLASRRAQYKSYASEANHLNSPVETFASVELFSDDEKWKNVPLRLITGKALSRKTTEIRVYLKKTREAQQNQIVFRIQPREGIAIQIFVKKPGLGREFTVENLGFNFPDDLELPDAYEQVLADAIASHHSLFTSSDEVIREWEILDPVQKAWAMDLVPLELYDKGAKLSELLDFEQE